MRPLLPLNRQDSESSRMVYSGFSLIEMMVALFFTMILMAGMASVFKTSIGIFAANSETMSSGRRNRMAMDMIFDDLNKAGMLPSSLFDYPSVSTTNPPFRITPNVPYDPLRKTDLKPAEAIADQLDFLYDEILPVDGTLETAISGSSDQVGNAGELSDNASITINFRDTDQAQQVKNAFDAHGLKLLIRSSGYSYTLTGATRSSSSVIATLDVTSTYTGTGSVSGATFAVGAPAGAGVNLIQPGRYIRYSIKLKALDPSSSLLTPCLMRDEVTYDTVKDSAAPFSTPDSSMIIAENVTGFKVFLSGDGGNTWAGRSTDVAWSDITGGVTGATSPQLNWQFASSSAPARVGMRNTNDSPFWFREIPVLVRADVTTRTMNKRTEYASVANTATYRTQTQSLVMTPRHFGLAYQPTVF